MGSAPLSRKVKKKKDPVCSVLVSETLFTFWGFNLAFSQVSYLLMRHFGVDCRPGTLGTALENKI